MWISLAFQVQFYFTWTEIVILHPICYLYLNSGVELESSISMSKDSG